MKAKTASRYSNRLFLISSGVFFLALVLGPIIYLKWPKKPVQTAPPAPAGPASVAPGQDVTFTAPIEAREVTTVAAPIQGTLDRVDVEAGQSVYEGQLLARIKNQELDNARDQAGEERSQAQSRVTNLESGLIAARLEASRAAAELSRAKSDYDQADKNAQRQQMLMQHGATPRIQYEKAMKDFESLKETLDNTRAVAAKQQERVDSLQRDLENARHAFEAKNSSMDAVSTAANNAEIHSPVDGVLVSVGAKAGDDVTPEKQDLFVIATDAGSLQVTVEPEPPVLARLLPELPASVQILELNLTFDGKISKIENDKVTVEFYSTDPEVRVGMNSIVRIKVP